MSTLSGEDNAYFLDLYARYRRDRHSVPADLAIHFDSLDGGGSNAASGASALAHDLQDAYRRFGHLEADLDPLAPNEHRDPVLSRLRDRIAAAGRQSAGLSLAGETRQRPLAEADTLLRSVYCGPAALEASHLQDEAERAWLHEAFEKAVSTPLTEAALAATLDSIALVDAFETFMHRKFTAKKRFGSEGAEASIVLLRELLRTAPGHGVKEVVMGGMHRGRLATLAVGFGKNPATLAAELMGRDLSDGAAFTGDVPYHLGYVGRSESGGQNLALTILPHPSHLLVVAPVALGYARAKTRRDDGGTGATLPILAHTDAAFAGQGLSAELLQLGGLDGYSAGGSIHLVVNNQIGFTTMPSEGRSAHYCTDVAKLGGAPVLHVNGDDTEAVARVAGLAMDWRARFGRDIVIDLVCYRRNGHNELDEPRFTQPGMWQRIDSHPTLRQIAAERFRDRAPHLLAAADAAAEAYRIRLQDGFDRAADVMPNEESIQNGAWTAQTAATEETLLQPVTTGVPVERLREIGLAASRIPDGIDAHPKVRRFYEARAETIRSGTDINFATAEALAFASLLGEGSRVRLSGQDAVRGTFTQRHSRVHDMATGETCIPLAAAVDKPGMLELINSPLTEYGVLGFEYGHSLLDPMQLTLWEAQFGDFMNGAQIAVDQYIVSAEAKWRLRSGLAILLPHGLEGQGPDHSSAKIERIAQLYAGGNLILANPSTPANLFHVLRRQIRAPWRKPLFLIAPKSLLRSRDAVSTLEEMGEKTGFEPVIAAPCPRPERVRRVVLCSGKIFYDFDRRRIEAGLEETVLPIRVEQICPFPLEAVRRALAPFGKAEFVWLQEEAENQGAWHFVRDALAAGGIELSRTAPVIARPPLPVAAGGSIERHEREQDAILRRALSL
ncbi:MAG: 2-oxoglutarate dehydrogenase E1 component [Nisaea sp.]|uniref:2-oxoglutarate dehydrogenase E1 component n=1 Tax=Nisaea sp. TaxID=2024842 RepID=UPI001B2B7023|nr:2-oxoglutarate dehydrogenase E1 component [Nisaea sp.]MBO6559262.1 2-oxoglutarate dehydrogenase E1 component [Nisaea sp.]